MDTPKIRPATIGSEAPVPRAIRLGMLPGLLGYELRLAQRAVFAAFGEVVSRDISPGLFGILVIVEANPGLKQTELSRAIGLDRSSIVPVINKLEARKLVARVESQADRRSYALFLTRRGAALLARARKRVIQHEMRVAQTLSARERAQLMRLLKKLHRSGD